MGASRLWSVCVCVGGGGGGERWMTGIVCKVINIQVSTLTMQVRDFNSMNQSVNCYVTLYSPTLAT